MTLHQTKFLYKALCFLAILEMTACASLPTENQDPAKNNKISYNKELKECQEDYPEAGSGVHIRQWVSCMKLKGWK